MSLASCLRRNDKQRELCFVELWHDQSVEKGGIGGRRKGGGAGPGARGTIRLEGGGHPLFLGSKIIETHAKYNSR